jgi:transcriptional regulator of acetoin/glycerol metabolism
MLAAAATKSCVLEDVRPTTCTCAAHVQTAKRRRQVTDAPAISLCSSGVASPRTERQDDSALAGEDRERRSTAHVRVVFGRVARDVYELGASGITIGREASDAHGIVANDARISRCHARIERGAAGWSMIDLGSRNGAFIDGKACAPNDRASLRDGSIIRVGDTVLVFRTSAAVDDGTPHAPAFPGVSPPAIDVRRRMDVLAKAAGHVLVLGATGTGKERVARAVARPGPFVVQNCAELTRDLARSELFGHVRGAFSGAAANKPGLVDEAQEGTLFLDEVGELPIDVQGELLRFLEDGSYRPVGGTELRHSRARIVAATNVDIDEAVAANRFRRDLAGRLRASNTPLELPPLRDRCEDIAARTFRSGRASSWSKRAARSQRSCGPPA